MGKMKGKHSHLTTKRSKAPIRNRRRLAALLRWEAWVAKLRDGFVPDPTWLTLEMEDIKVLVGYKLEYAMSQMAILRSKLGMPAL